MFGFNKKRANETVERQQAEADAALQRSQKDYEALQALKPAVEKTVQGHRRLQVENHFAERIWWAYAGGGSPK